MFFHVFKVSFFSIMVYAYVLLTERGKFSILFIFHIISYTFLPFVFRIFYYLDT